MNSSKHISESWRKSWAQHRLPACAPILPGVPIVGTVLHPSLGLTRLGAPHSHPAPLHFQGAPTPRASAQPHTPVGLAATKKGRGPHTMRSLSSSSLMQGSTFSSMLSYILRTICIFLALEEFSLNTVLFRILPSRGKAAFT